jgi:hypothetical protein
VLVTKGVEKRWEFELRSVDSIDHGVRFLCRSSARSDALPSRLETPEVPDEEVVAAALAVGSAAGTVAATGEHDQVEVLVGSDQGVDHLHGRSWVDVAIQLADGQ